MLKSEEILTRIEKLQSVMLQTPQELTCEWEVIAVEKIKYYFNGGALRSFDSNYMQVLNKFYKDYKYRKDLEVTDEQMLNYRKWDLLFSEDKQDELMYKLRYNYLYDDAIVPKDELHNDRLKILEIKRNLKDLSIEFDYDIDMMRIRINKKPGDLVMVENPFDDNHSFPAVIESSKIDDASNSPRGWTMRNEITWYKQDDKLVTGKSTITDYDINTNATLFAEEVQNLVQNLT